MYLLTPTAKLDAAQRRVYGVLSKEVADNPGENLEYAANSCCRG